MWIGDVRAGGGGELVFFVIYALYLGNLLSIGNDRESLPCRLFPPQIAYDSEASVIRDGIGEGTCQKTDSSIELSLKLWHYTT